MEESNRFQKPQSDAGVATAEAGVVVLDGPDGVAVTMTPEAAERTAASLGEAAHRARADGSAPARDETDEDNQRPGEA